VNGEAIVTEQTAAADALSRNLTVTHAMLGDALEDPSFLAALCALVNNGYWYFND
jgi:50S ribosomal protein L16 3-hydroxylase